MTAPPLPRDQFPVADRFRYLNHARLGAPPTVVAHALARDASAATMLGCTSEPRRVDRVETVRATCAALLGAAPDDVSFVRSTTEGLALVANGLHWSAGDQVVVADHEYPLTVAAFASLADLGVELVRVPSADDSLVLPPERVEAALVRGAGSVRAVVLSWVHYARGSRNDLAAISEIAHRYGAVVVADVIQGLGVHPADVTAWGVDAAAAGAQKWLLGPEGIGLLYTSPHLRDRLRLIGPGWTSMVTDRGEDPHFDPEADPTARRLEGGSFNLGGIGGLGASADLLRGTGIDPIWSHVDRWCDHLVDGLVDLGATVVSDRSPEVRSAIVSACFDDADADEVADRLVPHGVIASAWHGALRFSPHGWNDDHDLTAALRALHRVLRR